MKTAVSIPDPVFASAERLARRLKLSRSRLYATAVADFVKSHPVAGVTEKLNQVYAAEKTPALDPAVARLQARSLSRERW